MIDISNLSFAYRRGPVVLHKVSLQVAEGEMILLCGPTGSGKSTLLRCINGLIPHFYKGRYGGTAKIGGIDVREQTIAEISKTVGFVFQNPENQLVALTVERELAFGPENLGLPRGTIRERVDGALEKLDITHLREKSPFNLSGGEQQRVALAAILAMRPAVILLDEPTSNLDPKVAAVIIDLLARLNREEGTTVVITEHRLDLILPHVDRVVVLANGAVQATGTPSEVLANETVLSSGVDFPQITQLFQQLQARGLHAGPLPFTLAEAMRQLDEVVEAKRA